MTSVKVRFWIGTDFPAAALISLLGLLGMFAFRGRNRREVDRNADGAGLLRIKDHTGTVHAPTGVALAQRLPRRRRRAANRGRRTADT